MDATPSRSRVYLLVLFSYAALIGVYFVSRYDLHWTETDTSSIARTIQSVIGQATYQPKIGPIYSNGFAYQVVSAALVFTTGVPIPALQTILLPLIAPFGLLLAAFMFYSQVTKNRKTAALGVLILFFQPDLLFVTLRGSHEKLDWPLLMVALSLLYLSLGKPAKKTLVYIGLFYLCIFAEITTNVFFASVFLAAITLSMLIGLILEFWLQRRIQKSRSDFGRLFYVSLSGGILVYLVMVYIYPISQKNVLALQSIFDRTYLFLVSFEPKSQPYETISISWINKPTYFGLTLFTWLLIASSFIVWLWRGKNILGDRARLNLRENLDWLLYAGFALQIAVSIIVDFSGYFFSNLELRIFPGFTIMACVLLAQAVYKSVPALLKKKRQRWLLLGLAVFLASWFSMASMFKATNEPVLSNKWNFYSTTEEAALEWTDAHTVFSAIWTGVDERLREVFRLKYASESSSQNMYDAYYFYPDDSYVLYSQHEALRGQLMGATMPPVEDWSLLYDNGDVWVYHKRPLTPYQR